VSTKNSFTDTKFRLNNIDESYSPHVFSFDVWLTCSYHLSRYFCQKKEKRPFQSSRVKLPHVSPRPLSNHSKIAVTTSPHNKQNGLPNLFSTLLFSAKRKAGKLVYKPFNFFNLTWRGNRTQVYQLRGRCSKHFTDASGISNKPV